MSCENNVVGVPAQPIMSFLIKEVVSTGKIAERMLPRVINNEFEEEPFSRQRIIDSIVRETGLKEKIVREIYLETARRILISGVEFITAPEIREIICGVLVEAGYLLERLNYRRIGIPERDYEELLIKKPLDRGQLFFGLEEQLFNEQLDRTLGQRIKFEHECFQRVKHKLLNH